MLIIQQIINTMNAITTITDLPDHIIKIILRRVIVSSSIEAYSCINTRFTNICLKNMVNMTIFIVLLVLTDIFLLELENKKLQ